MSLDVLNAIEKKRREFGAVNLTVIKGKVPAIIRNYNEIKGRNYDKALLYRQVRRDDYPQPSFLENLFILYASATFASRARGSVLIDEVNRWEKWRAGQEPGFIARHRDFLAIEKDTATLRAERLQAICLGDFNLAYLLTVEIRRIEEEMLDAIVFAANGRLFNEG